jgi:hypothetical protein
MKYTEFVKANYGKVSNLPAKQRMAKLGQMWKASGHASGKGVAGGDVAGGIFIKRKGKGKKAVAKVRGKGIISDALGAFGLGMKKRGRKASGKGVAGGDAEGSGMLSDLVGSFGLGMKKRGRKASGKGVAGGEVAGGGIFSGLLGAVGLGMPDKLKLPHFNRMIALEKKLHADGKLTPASHNKLKVYHTLHGAGFFDSLFKGLKKGVSGIASVIPHAINALPQILKVIPQVANYIPAVGKLAAPLATVAKFAPLLGMV